VPFCSYCGKEIQEDARFCSYCGKPVKGSTRELRIEQINVPYPDADSARLEIVVGAAGRLNVKDGAGEAFIEGTIEYDVPEWVPQVHVHGNTVRLIQEPRF